MKKQYKEQLDQIHMPEHLRKQILKESRRCKKTWYTSSIFKYTCVATTCVCFVVITLFTLKHMDATRLNDEMKYVASFNQEEKIKSDNRIDKICGQEKKVSEDKCVKDGSTGFYGGGKTGFAMGSMPVLASEAAEGKEMPIFEIRADQEPNVLKSILEVMDIPWYKDVNSFENSAYKVEFDQVLSYTVTDQQVYAASDTTEVYEQYYAYLPLINPIQSCDKNDCLIYEQQDDRINDYVNKALFSVRFSMQNVSDDGSFQVRFSGFDTSRLEKLESVKLITQKEAEQRLLEGDSYSLALDKKAIKSEDIIDVNIVYTGLNEYSPTYPYVVPVYRYHVMQNAMKAEYDVLALEQKDLEKLNKVSW